MTKINNPLKDDYDPREFIGRFVKNEFGHSELLTMQALYWDYLDWLVEGVILDEDTLIRHACERYPAYHINAAVVWWLHKIYEHREAKGLNRPSWLSPSLMNPPARPAD